MRSPDAPNFQRWFETGPELYIVVTPTFDVVAVSDAYLRATLLRREDAVGRPLFDLFPDNPDNPHANGQHQVRASFHRVLAARQSDLLPVQRYDIRHPDGHFEERFWRLSSHPLLNDDGTVAHILHHIEDVTQSTREMHRSDERLRRLVDVGVVPIAFFNLDGHIHQANDAYLEMLGFTRAELEAGAIRWDRLTPPEWDVVTERALADLRTRGRYDPYEKEYFRKDGSKFWALFGGAMLTQDEGVVFTLDITERKNLEHERLRVLEAERTARVEAERAGRIKDEFLATLSHELRTPLNAILGWAQILGRPRVSPEDFAQGIETIERNARVQTQIIEDLLDMSRIVSGKIRLDVQYVELQNVVTAAVESVHPLAEAKGVRVKKVIDPLAGPVSGDPSRLQQVLWNLLTNAIKFTPSGGLVQVLLERVNSHLEITVSDNGQGIAPDFLPHVFERFRQQDSSTTRTYGGLGLGLSIAKQLIELHSGTIRAKSSGAGQGSTFTISLPLAPLRQVDKDRAHPAASTGSSPVPSSASLRGLTVLVVDDEPDARSLIRRVLTDAHASVVLAEGAVEALDAVHRHKPDLIVSDIGMPVRDGYDLIREIRALPVALGGRAPAIALTAFARTEDRTRAMLAGYQVHIAKPIEPQELVAALASLAGRTGHSPA